MDLILQIAFLSAVSFYLISQRIAIGRRIRQTFESIIDRLSNSSFGAETPLPEMSVRQLWITQRQAGVILELADYGDRNGADRTVTSSLRSDALAIRWRAMQAILTRLRWV